jgi:IS4 transposase
LRDLLNYLPWREFDRLVDEHGADHRVRKLRTKDQLIALIFAQLSGMSGLRGIASGLGSQANALYHLGARPVARSTLSDANTKRPAAVFTELFAALVQRTSRGLRGKTGEAMRLIDATTLPLNKLSEDWSRQSTKACGAKAHVVYDPQAERPVYFSVTAAKVADITAAKSMPVEPGATYVFDLGYYDFAWWAKLDQARCRIVTRLKKNTPLTVIKERPLPKRTPDHILSDRIGTLPERLARSRRNPMAKPVPEIRLRNEAGKTLRIITNDLKSSAEKIADLYKQRWDIELFFTCIKQNLKIKKFLGTTENAVRIQVAAALIAYLLLHAARAACRITIKPLEFASLVRLNLMQRRPLDSLHAPPDRSTPDQRQFSLSLSPC